MACVTADARPARASQAAPATPASLIAPEGSRPRADVPSSAAALAGTARPSRTPASSRRSPPPRWRRSAPRAPTPGSALPCPSARRPSGSRTTPRPRPRRRARSRGQSGRRKDEERLLVRLGVVEDGLPGLQDGHVDPSWANSTGGSPYSLSKAHLAPLRSENHHSASRTLTTNQPWVTGVSPDPKSSSCASGTTRFSQLENVAAHQALAAIAAAATVGR
jgi:hypothetical protein